MVDRKMGKKTDERFGGWCWEVFGRPFSNMVTSVGSGARCLGLNLSSGISWLCDHGQMNHSL